MRAPGESRRRYLERHTFELLIAALSVIATISFIADPTTLRQTAVGQQLAGWDWVWMLGYGTGGLLIVAGLAWPKPRLEAVGLLMLCAAVAIYAIAVYQVAGSVGTAAIATYVAIGLACAGRVATMLRASR